MPGLRLQPGHYSRIPEVNLKAPVKVGDKVKFVSVFELAPDPVYDTLGEIGTATQVTVVHTETKCWNVWRVKFDDRTIWIKEKGLEIVG
jgi:hypothetical protein